MNEITASHLGAIFEQAPLAMAVVQVGANDEFVYSVANAAFRDLAHLPSNAVDLVCTLFGDTDHNAICSLLGSEVEHLLLQFDTTLKVGRSSLACAVTARRLLDEDQRKIMLSLAPATAGGAHEPVRSNAKTLGEQQREDFIATLTHDLKTPIIGANMVLSALLDGSVGELQPAQTDIISKLRTSNQALLKMIQNLLEVYKYEAGTESLRFVGANLTEIVHFCADDVRPLTENKHIELNIVCEHSELPLICDEYAIKRVLINLLSNAVKFTPVSGTISVQTFAEDNVAHVLVKDTGRGIAEEDRQKLFQRFWQGESGRKYSAGTGLGLYFCHNVVSAHGGKISCESGRDTGTTFRIELPKHVSR